jgi:L-fucose mutarotase/ribose pyranase (RbsD/FucU family)
LPTADWPKQQIGRLDIEAAGDAAKGTMSGTMKLYLAEIDADPFADAKLAMDAEGQFPSGSPRRSRRPRNHHAPGNTPDMLKAIDPILNADVLYALRAMGHGDDLIICDTNFPADAVARETVFGELLRIDNVTAARAAKAILSVMPLDGFVDQPAKRMEVVASPTDPPVRPIAGRNRRRRGQVVADGHDRAFAFTTSPRRPASSRPAPAGTCVLKNSSPDAA